MKKTVPFLCLLAWLYLSPFSPVSAQLPTITSQVGLPVGMHSGQQLAYGNGKYLLLGGYNSTTSLNSIYTSATGTAWAQVTTIGLVTAQLNHLAFGAGVFVVVGNNGVIQTSADGTTWTTQTSGTTNDLNKIYFVNNRFFAIGKKRTLLTSADGIAWTAVAFNAGDPDDFFLSLTYGNGAYVLSARKDYGSQAIVYRSTTAADNTWTVNNTALGLGESVNRIQFLNDKFFAFLIGQRMFTSTDGITWTDITSSIVLTNPDGTTAGWGDGNQIFHAIWDGTKYHFYGSSTYYRDYNSGYGSTFTSTDGRNLTLLTKTAYIIPQDADYINGKYFVCGNEGIVSSSDGLTYQHPGSSFRDMVKTTNKYVAVGTLGADGRLIGNSSDFSTWTARGPNTVRELYAVAYDGTNVLAAGSQNILRSTDEGDSWTTVYNNNAETVTALSYGNGRFVAGGYGAAGGFLRASTDGGQTWTSVDNSNFYFVRIKYVNNRFFALGYDNDTYLGRLLTSVDGSNWTDVTPDLGFEVLYFSDVVFDGTKYHVLGTESAGYTPVGFFTVSTATPDDGASYGNKAAANNAPAGAVLGGSYDEGVLNYTAGKFTGAVIDVNTGQDYIITSTNGSSWTVIPQNSYSTITAAVSSGSTVRMLGRGNAFFTVDYSGTLPVTLLQFSGVLKAGAAQLRWVTASEQNTKQFLVQHSVSGSGWATIGVVAATGNSSQPVSYQFTHATPAKGANLYRLQMQDANGSTKQSRIISIDAGGTNSVTIFPNPASDKFVVQTADGRKGSIVLYNAAGQPVKMTTIAGSYTVVDIASLPTGIYQAEVLLGTERSVVSVVKN
jgi:hypothetical protein